MRESCTSGDVRGVPGNRDSYRDTGCGANFETLAPSVVCPSVLC